ncbi:MAG TPA: response regulator, partial [Rheinheimera sp.]|nr:response regulator [Rheinheimera sp.]
KQKLAAEPTSIHKDILDTIDLISHSVDKRIVFNTSFNAQRDVVMGEKSFLQSAFLNLAKNASDAMSNGGVLTISTENVWSRDSQRLASEPDKKVGEYIKISFRDTGCGISAENQTKIFEPFFTTKAIGAGTGMGLPSVYGTIKSHSGFIYLESELGVGTEFILYLPIADQNYTKIFSAETNPISTGQANAKKILVVDDEVQLREIYFDLLTSSGYEIVLAENGKDAIEKYRDQYTTFDLIILDLAMPVMDGSDAYDVIKQINPNAKVIVSSGYNSHESLNSIKTKGINDVIEKPFTLSELVTIVKKVLDS